MTQGTQGVSEITSQMIQNRVTLPGFSSLAQTLSDMVNVSQLAPHPDNTDSRKCLNLHREHVQTQFM